VLPYGYDIKKKEPNQITYLEHKLLFFILRKNVDCIKKVKSFCRLS
jgi:hypothetical protein